MKCHNNSLKYFRILISMIVCMAGLNGAVMVAAADPLQVGQFSSERPGESLPQGWEPLVFKNIDAHTRYTMVQENGRVVVKAQSTASASGLIRKIRIDPNEYPVVRWQWKVANVLEKGDVTRKEGDDYPARLYITFEYDPKHLSFLDRTKYKAAKLIYGEYPPTAAINYIWGSHAEVGLVTPNPYTDRAMMIVLESGAQRLNQWVEVERNILEDYHRAFHSDPPAISGVAIMTDTDNTRESAVAYFGDIVFDRE